MADDLPHKEEHEDDEGSEDDDEVAVVVESDEHAEDVMRQGKAKMAETEYEAAVGLFGSVVNYFREKYGDDRDIRLAPYYVAVGEAELYMFQDESAADPLGTDTGPNSLLQVSWETLDLSRHLFYKKSQQKDISEEERVEAELFESRARCHLGHLQMEKDMWTEALWDFEQSLKVQDKHKSTDDALRLRCLFGLGLSNEALFKFPAATRWYEQALVVANRLGNTEVQVQLAEKIKDLRDESELKESSAQEIRRMVRDALAQATPQATPTPGGDGSTVQAAGITFGVVNSNIGDAQTTSTAAASSAESSTCGEGAAAASGATTVLAARSRKRPRQAAGEGAGEPSEGEPKAKIAATTTTTAAA